MSITHNFKAGQSVVYPSHGVGVITGFDEQEYDGVKLDMITVKYDRKGMTQRIPKNKATSTGLRPVSDKKTIAQAFETLRDSPRPKHGLWARRVRVLQDQLHSGDIILISRLLRDLAPKTRTENGLSLSEREYYSNAMEMLSDEISAVTKRTTDFVKAEIEKALSEQKPPIINKHDFQDRYQ